MIVELEKLKKFSNFKISELENIPLSKEETTKANEFFQNLAKLGNLGEELKEKVKRHEIFVNEIFF